MNLLNSLVRQTSVSSSTKTTKTSTHLVVIHGTDHRMAPQKRVLEEEYGINFPTKKLCSESSNHLCLDGQDKSDFHMALKLQGV